MKLLNYLDNQIELFWQKNEDYPKEILMNKETKSKLWAELKDGKEKKENNSWQNQKNNYRGIPVKIKKDVFLELKGVTNGE